MFSKKNPQTDPHFVNRTKPVFETKCTRQVQQRLIRGPGTPKHFSTTKMQKLRPKFAAEIRENTTNNLREKIEISDP